MVRELGGALVVAAASFAILLGNVWVTGWVSPLPWQKPVRQPKNDSPTTVVLHLAGIVLLAASLGAAVDYGLHLVFGLDWKVGATLVLVVFAALLVHNMWVAAPVVLLSGGLVGVFLADPGLLSAQGMLLIPLLALIGTTSGLTRRPAGLAPDYRMVSIPFMLLLLAVAAGADMLLALDAESVYRLMVEQRAMEGIMHAVIPSDVGTTWDAVRYAAPLHSMGLFTPLAALMLVGATTMWSRYYSSKALLVWPILGWVGGVAGSLTVAAVSGGHHVLGAPYLAGAMLLGVLAGCVSSGNESALTDLHLGSRKKSPSPA